MTIVFLTQHEITRTACHFKIRLFFSQGNVSYPECLAHSLFLQNKLPTEVYSIFSGSVMQQNDLLDSGITLITVGVAISLFVRK